MRIGSAVVAGRGGFTLVEVTLAILVVALGLLSVFSLFPTGLRASEDDVADTRAGMFAETVFGRMRAGADELVQWSEWSNPATFSSKVLTNRNAAVDVLLVDGGTIQAVDFPKGSGQQLRYRLTIDTSDTLRYPTKLEVCDGQYGPFQFQSTFYSEFLFKGM